MNAPLLQPHGVLAQSLIALVNTLLTTLGLIILKIPGTGFLSALVGVCSFIPVAGIFLSTIPMMAVALSEHGVVRALQVCVI
jgi:predicted PurR-regulated permease PerM